MPRCGDNVKPNIVKHSCGWILNELRIRRICADLNFMKKHQKRRSRSVRKLRCAPGAHRLGTAIVIAVAVFLCPTANAQGVRYDNFTLDNHIGRRKRYHCACPIGWSRDSVLQFSGHIS